MGKIISKLLCSHNEIINNTTDEIVNDSINNEIVNNSTNDKIVNDSINNEIVNNSTNDEDRRIEPEPLKVIKHILLADDNFLIRQCFEEIMNYYKCSITVMNNGKDVMDIINNGSIYDVIILDINMYPINGIQCIKELRKNKYEGLVFGLTGVFNKKIIIY